MSSSESYGLLSNLYDMTFRPFMGYFVKNEIIDTVDTVQKNFCTTLKGSQDNSELKNDDDTTEFSNDISKHPNFDVEIEIEQSKNLYFSAKRIDDLILMKGSLLVGNSDKCDTSSLTGNKRKKSVSFFDSPRQEDPKEQKCNDDDSSSVLSVSQPIIKNEVSLKNISNPVGIVKRKKILIIESASLERKFLCRLLQKRGHLYETASNGQEGVNMVKATLPLNNYNINIVKFYDVILLDLSISDLNNVETTEVDLAREIRNIGYKGMIIGVTACLPDEAEAFLKAGVTNIITKPYKMHVINALIDDLRPI